MTPDEEGFFRTILDHPDDDAPRLIYADWLEERGRAERAEYIRVQIEAAKLADDDPGVATLLSRADELLPKLFEGFHDCRSALQAISLRRGFVVLVHIWGDKQLRRFLMSANQFFDFGPVRHLIVEARGWRLQENSFLPPADVKVLLSLPQMSLVRRLTLGNLGPTAVHTLTTSPFLAGLEYLHIQRSYFDPLRMDKLRRRFGKRVSFS